MPSLQEIFQLSGTDKGYMHGYHRYYERELAMFRAQPGVRLLEIGVGGGHSLLAWSQYFVSPGALHGLDKTANEELRGKVCTLVGERVCPVVRIFPADQGNMSALHSVVASEPAGWDIIIDDGSHVPAHQVLTFTALFPALQPGGIYVIEDLTTSYQSQGQISGYPLFGGVRARYPGSAVEKFKELADVVMRRHFMSPDFTVLGRHIDSTIARVSFGDGILFVEKRPHGGDWDLPFPPPERVQWWQIPPLENMARAATARREARAPMEKALERLACSQNVDQAAHAAAAAAVAEQPA